eukprot:CAMPEP_0198149026 /NCGR_PEP_ID=MMETSP1443-20131203/44687_1 /TAXON_ID=186043 /ORGANISM="Entomoneis sp., Strain CCMP2396" /LENGTH=32 /DNA_ID= /DNA_START= /DNA_END= /DNA_ORIENTATION=
MTIDLPSVKSALLLLLPPQRSTSEAKPKNTDA